MVRGSWYAVRGTRYEVEAEIAIEVEMFITSTFNLCPCNFSIYSYIYQLIGGLAHPDSYREARACDDLCCLFSGV